MKTHLCGLLACALLINPSFGEDLKSPKPEANRSIRVLLHLTGSDRLIDYPDVYKIHTCQADLISFETNEAHWFPTAGRTL